MSVAVKDLPLHDAMVANILAAYEDATPEDLAHGLDWYASAYRLAYNIAAATEYSAEQIAGIIAVISPRLAWSKNTIYPALIVDYHRRADREVKNWRHGIKGMAVTHTRRLKCLRILDGEPVLQHLGQKTGNFYLNILGDAAAVTVDTWATKIALADPFREESPGTAAYVRIAAAYADAAEFAGISPRDMQAATWVTWRRIHGYGKVK